MHVSKLLGAMLSRKAFRIMNVSAYLSPSHHVRECSLAATRRIDWISGIVAPSSDGLCFKWPKSSSKSTPLPKLDRAK